MKTSKRILKFLLNFIFILAFDHFENYFRIDINLHPSPS